MRQDALDGYRLFEALFAEGSAHVQLRHIADGEAVEELVLSESHRSQVRAGNPGSHHTSRAGSRGGTKPNPKTDSL